MQKICDTIPEQNMSVADLKAEYAKVLQQKTSSAFVDGKTSHEYRAERFATVLQNLGVVNVADVQIQQFLLTYEQALTAALELKSGARDLFKTLKSLEKRIVVITEGPQDAQIRTVEALGLSQYIDFLATTNHFRVSKLDGLYQKVLDELGIEAKDMIMIGDNFQRDVEPAMNIGIFAIHYAEKENASLETYPPKINTLKALELIISEELV